jgi:excisionase family DNA binding protein
MGDYLTRKEVADLLKLPLRTLDYRVASKQIPYSRVSKRNVRFSRSQIDRWFLEREGIEFHRNMQKTA